MVRLDRFADWRKKFTIATIELINQLCYRGRLWTLTSGCARWCSRRVSKAGDRHRVTRVEVSAGGRGTGSKAGPVPEGVAGLTLGRLHTGFLTHLEKSVQKTYGQVVVLQVVKWQHYVQAGQGKILGWTQAVRFRFLDNLFFLDFGLFLEMCIIMMFTLPPSFLFAIIIYNCKIYQ